MQIKLHSLASTTPKTREYIWKQVNEEKRSRRSVALELGISCETARKWAAKEREGNFQDKPCIANKLMTKLNKLEEEVIVFLRQETILSVRDIAIVLQNVFKEEIVSRKINYSKTSIQNCLQRNKIPDPKKIASKEKKKEVSIFDPEYYNKCGFIHIDMKYLPRIKTVDGKAGARNYLFAAIDRATRYVYLEITQDHSKKRVAEFLNNFVQDFAQKGAEVHTILTDNGGEFTDRFAINSKYKKQHNIEPDRPTLQHPFDLVCKKNNIQHKLTRPWKPQTNGMIERYNRRISEWIAQKKAVTGLFESVKELEEYLLQMNYNYNRTRLQCLEYQSPLEKLAKMIWNEKTNENKDVNDSNGKVQNI